MMMYVSTSILHKSIVWLNFIPGQCLATLSSYLRRPLSTRHAMQIAATDFPELKMIFEVGAELVQKFHLIPDSFDHPPVESPVRSWGPPWVRGSPRGPPPSRPSRRRTADCWHPNLGQSPASYNVTMWQLTMLQVTVTADIIGFRPRPFNGGFNILPSKVASDAHVFRHSVI